MRGRTPSRPKEVVEPLHGSDKAKQRLQAILETMTGQLRVAEACDRLGICEQRFRQLRAELLQAALQSLEGLPSGRPPRPEPSEETVALREEVERLKRGTQIAAVREEIALALPHVTQAAPAPQKKRK